MSTACSAAAAATEPPPRCVRPRWCAETLRPARGRTSCRRGRGGKKARFTEMLAVAGPRAQSRSHSWTPSVSPRGQPHSPAGQDAVPWPRARPDHKVLVALALPRGRPTRALLITVDAACGVVVDGAQRQCPPVLACLGMQKLQSPHSPGNCGACREPDVCPCELAKSLKAPGASRRGAQMQQPRHTFPDPVISRWEMPHPDPLHGGKSRGGRVKRTSQTQRTANRSCSRSTPRSTVQTAAESSSTPARPGQRHTPDTFGADHFTPCGMRVGSSAVENTQYRSGAVVRFSDPAPASQGDS